MGSFNDLLSWVRNLSPCLPSTYHADKPTRGSDCWIDTQSKEQEIMTQEDWKRVYLLTHAGCRSLLGRGIKGELLPSEVATKIIPLIQQKGAIARRTCPPLHELNENSTADLELDAQGWLLWDVVDKLARQDERHHDVLIAFMNAFYSLVKTQEPWSIWGLSVEKSGTDLLCLTIEGGVHAGPHDATYLPPRGVPGETDEEQRMNSWCNFCRFVARMTRDTEHDFTMYLFWFAKEALEDCWWVCEDPDAAILALEGVIDVYGVQMFRSEKDFGPGIDKGGNGTQRRWKGKSGFCKERQLFWEAGLLDIAQDSSHRRPGVRDSARRTAKKMQVIRVREEMESIEDSQEEE